MISRPLSNLTPGSWDHLTPPQTRERSVSIAKKWRVLRAYGYGQIRAALSIIGLGVVIDHYIPLALFGDNTDANLYPQERATARLKDVDENRLAADWHTGRKTQDVCVATIKALWGPV